MSGSRFAVILVVLVFALAGCGGGTQSSVFGGSSSASTATAASSGTIIVDMPDGAAGRASAPTAFRFTGSDAAGHVLYGPVTLSVRPVVTLTGVPSGVISLFVEPLTDGRPSDAFAFPVSVTETPFVIPNGLDPAGHATAINVAPNSASITAGATQQFSASGQFPDGSRHDLSGTVMWTAAPAAVASIVGGLATGATIGAATITAALDGVTGTAALAVTGVSSTTTLTSSVNPSIVGQGVTFTADVTAPSGTPDGTVTFRDGATALGTATLAGGRATLTTSMLAVGAHGVTATYGGSAVFTASTSSNLLQTVNLDVGGVSVGSSQNPSVFGQSVTFTAIVTAVPPASGTPSGTVTFRDGATVLAANVALDGSGQATTSQSSLSVGGHTVTVDYSGDATFVPATSPPLTQTVNTSATTTALVSSLNPSTVGQSVTFTATVTAAAPGAGTPSGSVTFSDGATSLGTATLTAGVATFSTASLPIGSHPIIATYGGAPSFAGSTSTALTQMVSWASRTSGTSSDLRVTCFGGAGAGLFTAAGDAQTVRISTDGITWSNSAVALEPHNYLAMVYGNGAFVVSGDQNGRFFLSATAASGSWSTTGGIVWATDATHGMAAGNGSVVIVTERGGQPMAFTSHGSPPLSSGNFTNLGALMRAVSYGAGTRFVTVGDGGAIQYADITSDTPTWIAATSPTTSQLNGIASDGARYVAVGAAGAMTVSTDGATFTTAGVTSGTTASLNAIAAGGGRFVAVGDSGTILVSTDGLTWTPQPSGTTANLNGVTFGNGSFVVVGAGGAVLTSF